MPKITPRTPPPDWVPWLLEAVGRSAQPPRVFFSIREVAEAIGVDYDTALRWEHEGDLPPWERLGRARGYTSKTFELLGENARREARGTVHR